jgi:hypothetical protein
LRDPPRIAPAIAAKKPMRIGALDCTARPISSTITPTIEMIVPGCAFALMRAAPWGG